MDFINELQRRDVFERVLRTVNEKFVSPRGHYPNTAQLEDEHRREILRADSGEEFEAAMNRMPIASAALIARFRYERVQEPQSSKSWSSWSHKSPAVRGTQGSTV